LRPYYEGEARSSIRALLGSTSATEANFTLQLLMDVIPSDILVRACNLREVIQSLPRTPVSMHVDEQTLADTLGLERSIASMGKALPDGIELYIMTAGNCVLDLIIQSNGKKHFWNPVSINEAVTAEVIDLCIESDYLLRSMIELAEGMGLVFNPTFYVSINDWLEENVADALSGLSDFF